MLFLCATHCSVCFTYILISLSRQSWSGTIIIIPNYTGEKIKVEEVRNLPEVTETVSNGV